MVIQALKSFDHNGLRRKFETFVVSDSMGKQLTQRGLAKEVKADPPTAAGEKSSALQAAPASQEQTQKKSKRGKRKKRDAE